jgi:DNA end-binding protein Ku
MPRGLWSGTLAFGLVAVPVELVSAVRDMDVRFHEVDPRGQRVEVKRTCVADGKEVPWEEVGHGYELDGRLVVLSDEELAAAAPERTRTIEQLVAVRERDGLLALSTMLFADEIRDPRGVDAVPSDRKSAPRRREVEEAVGVIDAMTRAFDPSRYEDCHRKRLLRLIQRKRRGGEVKVPEVEPEPEPAPDLMAALEASLSRVTSRA